MAARFAIFCTLLMLSSCTKPLPSRVRSSRGTCETTCATYDYCKGNTDETRTRICVAECRSIFSEDGRVDEQALLNLQRLDRPDLLAFIEGPQKHEIGADSVSPPARKP